MTDEKLPRLQAIFFALSNPKRIEIYELCLKKKLNITQIKGEIKQSYKSVLNNLRILEDAEMIKKTKVKTEKAQESFIESIPFRKETVYYKVYKEIKREK